mgnify:CR=1 FL=1
MVGEKWEGGGGLKGKITPRELISCETSYLSLQWLWKSLNDDDAGHRGGRGLKGKKTPTKLILFETRYLSLQWLLKSLNDDDTGIAAQVDLKTSTLKPLHANWVINIYNLIPNAQN